jgi:hypothetical protein
VRLPWEASVASRPEDHAVEGEKQCGEHDSGDEQSLLHASILRQRSPGVGTACTPLHECLHVSQAYVAAIRRRHVEVALAADEFLKLAHQSSPFFSAVSSEVDRPAKP